MHSHNPPVESHGELLRRIVIPADWHLRLYGVIASIRALAPRLVALLTVVALQIVLLLIALVPANLWASHGLPNGPVPPEAAPIIAGLFYVLPSLTGLLAHRWQAAVILATLPAWLDLGIFAVAAATRIGPFYLATEPHAVSTVGTIELFAVLGVLGWLARAPVMSALSYLLSLLLLWVSQVRL